MTSIVKLDTMRCKGIIRTSVFIWIILWLQICEVRAKMELYNVTTGTNLKRDKRFIVFTEFGVHKFIAGFSFPTNLYDKKPWRSLGGNVNLQGQFGVPLKPWYWWDKWNGRSLIEAKQQYDKDGTYVPDESRVFVYALIEYFLNRDGRNGKECLLRAICENAMVDESEGILGEIIRAVLRPTEDSAGDYRDAYKAGRYGTVCITMYPKCPIGQGLFDGLTHTHVTKYVKGS